MEDLGYLKSRFYDDESARLYLEALRWPEGPVCVFCQATVQQRRRSPPARVGMIHCGHCHKDYTVTLGCLLKRTLLPLHTWIAAASLVFSTDRQLTSISSRRELDINYKTAQLMRNRMKLAGNVRSPDELLTKLLTTPWLADQEETKEEESLPTFEEAYFHNEDAARVRLESIRWPGGPTCIHCDSQEMQRQSMSSYRDGLYICGTCGTQYTVTVNTLLMKHHVPLYKWFLAAGLFVHSDRPLTSIKVRRTLKVNYRTASLMESRLDTLPPSASVDQLMESLVKAPASPQA